MFKIKKRYKRIFQIQGNRGTINKNRICFGLTRINGITDTDCWTRAKNATMYNTTLKYYNENGQQLSDRYETADVSDLHDFLRQSFSPPAKLLELGCGSGRDSAFMLENGFDVIATDGSSAMTESAALHHPELGGRLEIIHLPDGLTEALGIYDGIFAIAVLMHLSRENMETAMGKIYALLSTSGKFCFSVPIQRDDIKMDEFDGKGRRFTALTQNGWIQLCQSHGFRILQSFITTDGLDRPGIKWLNCLTQKVE